MDRAPIAGNDPMTQPTQLRVFYSYAHEDEALCEKLRRHLTALEHEGTISQWTDRKILPGAQWARDIQTNLEQAEIILLLVSADFLASDYCRNVEESRALERAEAGDAAVVPIILRDCDWQATAFARFQALPTGAKAVKDWGDDDQALADVARWIRLLAADLRAERGHISSAASHRKPIFRNLPFTVLGEDYDPLRALKQVINAAESGAGGISAPPLHGTIQWHAVRYQDVLAELHYGKKPTGLPYDLVAIPYAMLGHCVTRGLLQPLDDDLAERHAERFFWWQEMGTWEQQLYGVPLSALTRILAVRQDRFEDPRLGLTPPDTWNDYRALVRDADPRSMPLAPELLHGRCHVTLWYDWLTHLYAHDTNDLVLYGPRRMSTYATAKTLEAGTLSYLEHARDLAPWTEHEGLPHWATTNWDDSLACFAAGRLLMQPLFNDSIGALRERMSVLHRGRDFTFAVQPAPRGSAHGRPQSSDSPAALECVRFLPMPRATGSGRRNGHVEGWVLCIPAASLYAQAAHELLDWFLDDAVQRQYTRWGGASALRSRLEEVGIGDDLPDDAYAASAQEAFRASIADGLDGRAEIDTVKWRGPETFETVDRIIRYLYDAVLDVCRRGLEPAAATRDFLARVQRRLRATAG